MVFIVHVGPAWAIAWFSMAMLLPGTFVPSLRVHVGMGTIRSRGS